MASPDAALASVEAKCAAAGMTLDNCLMGKVLLGVANGRRSSTPMGVGNEGRG